MGAEQCIMWTQIKTARTQLTRGVVLSFPYLIGLELHPMDTPIWDLSFYVTCLVCRFSEKIKDKTKREGNV